ncbi:MAG: carbohydrate kinase family protein [Bacteroidaceae bacterium]|nr:carbohydrate kinase family protein [Bacteroidaceae bacterium]
MKRKKDDLLKQPRRGIVCAGNWLLDYVNFIPTYPEAGNLVTIEKLSTGFGGCAHNVVADLAGLKTDLPLYACGCIGSDSPGNDIMKLLLKLNIDATGMERTNQPTSYTQVMSDSSHATRTFFHNRGANALLNVDHLMKVNAPAKIFHLGYLLLLDALDADDGQYGTRAARALHDLQQKGYLTSVDVVSEESDRFRKIVLPSLRYIDYFIINEVEAGKCFGYSLRSADGKILLPKVAEAAEFLISHGVRRVCAIHFPEGGYALTKEGETRFVPSIRIPASGIVSSVGAGDAFTAGMLYALHENYSLTQALRIGAASAYYNLKSPTSTGGAPRLTQIEEFIKTHYE